MSIKQLYKISDDYQGLVKLVEDGEVTQEMIAETLEGVTGLFEEKAQAVVTINNDFKRNVDVIDAEIARLSDMKKSIVNQQNSLKEYLRLNMERTGITKIKCDLFTITLRKASQTAVITNESELPDEYVTVKTVVAPDKRSILTSLKNGEEIPGAELSLGKTSLLIK